MLNYFNVITGKGREILKEKGQQLFVLYTNSGNIVVCYLNTPNVFYRACYISGYDLTILNDAIWLFVSQAHNLHPHA